MAIAFVQSTAKALGTNGGTTVAINTTGANFFVVAVAYFTGSGGTPTVSDSQSLTWNALTLYTATNVALKLFWATGTGTASHTFTASGTSIFAAAAVQAFSGIQTSPSPFEAGTDKGAASAASPISLATGSLTYAANSLMISAACFNAAETLSAPSDTLTYTLTNQINFSGGVNEGVAMAYSIQSGASGSSNPSWGNNAGTASLFCVAAAAFQGASAATQSLFRPAEALTGLGVGGPFFKNPIG